MIFSFSTYEAIQKHFFPNIDVEKTSVDFIHHFFVESYTEYAKQYQRCGRINYRQAYRQGEIKSCQFTLQPKRSGAVKRHGYELYNTILKYFNNEYWLASLWIAMYEHNKDSALGREIVRAFMKNSVKQTASHICLIAPSEVTHKNINRSMLEQLDFYNQVFNVSNIYQNMRESYKAMLKFHTKQDSTSDLTIQLVELYQDGYEKEVKNILSEHGMAAYIPLIEFSQLNKQKNHLNGIGDTMKLLLRKHNQKKELRNKIRNIMDFVSQPKVG